jgi:hypothetical protein
VMSGFSPREARRSAGANSLQVTENMEISTETMKQSFQESLVSLHTNYNIINHTHQSSRYSTTVLFSSFTRLLYQESNSKMMSDPLRLLRQNYCRTTAER